MHSLSIVKLFLEEEGKRKAIIMAGGGGAGKSWILNQLNVKGIPVLNPDEYVEKEDMSLAAASSLIGKQVDKLSQEGSPFIWDTTASKPEKIKELINKGYDVLMVMVYTHPLISFLSNFERERKLPKSAVFSTWYNAYSLIQEYKDMLGDNFLLYVNTRQGKYDTDIKEFTQAAKEGPMAVKAFLDNIIKQDPEKFSSTFAKPFEIENPDARLAFEEEIKTLQLDREDESLMKQLKRHFMKKWDKDRIGPGTQSMETKLKAILRTRQAQQQNYIKDIENTTNKIRSSEFQSLLQSHSLSKIKSKVNNFIQ